MGESGIKRIAFAVVALACIGSTAADAAPPTADQFGLHCVGKTMLGADDTHFSIDLNRSLFCAVSNCDGFKGSVIASPDLLTLHFYKPGTADTSPMDVTYRIARNTGEYSYALGRSEVGSGSCEREDFTAIPKNKF